MAGMHALYGIAAIFLQNKRGTYGMNRRQVAFCYSTFERLWNCHNRNAVV